MDHEATQSTMGKDEIDTEPIVVNTKASLSIMPPPETQLSNHRPWTLASSSLNDASPNFGVRIRAIKEKIEFLFDHSVGPVMVHPTPLKDPRIAHQTRVVGVPPAAASRISPGKGRLHRCCRILALIMRSHDAGRLIRIERWECPRLFIEKSCEEGVHVELFVAG